MVARISIGATKDDLHRVAAENHDWRLELEADGTLTVSPPAGSASGLRNAALTAKMRSWGQDHGYVVFDSSAGFEFQNGAVLSPDTSLVAIARWRALSSQEREDFAPIVPDIVIELVSKTYLQAETLQRLELMRFQGARFVVMIDPYRNQVWTDGDVPEDFPTNFDDVVGAADV